MRFLAPLVCCTGAMAQPASFQGIGDLPGSSFASTAYGVSADGQVVVGSSVTSGGDVAIRWTATSGIVPLDTAPAGFNSHARATSVDGSVIVGVRSGQNTEAFRWTSATGMVGLGDLPGGDFYSYANDVSGDGAIVVGQSHAGTSPNLVAYRWTQALGMHTFLPVLISTTAASISGDGLTIVGQRGSFGYRWTAASGMVLIDEPMVPYHVSGDGSVIVGQHGGCAAFRWTAATGVVCLGKLPGASNALAYSCTDDGSIVVGAAIGYTAGPNQAFIWDAPNGLRSLRDFLQDDRGLNLAGWLLRDAHGITPDGKVIVGAGTNPCGQPEGWIADLALSPPATPTATRPAVSPLPTSPASSPASSPRTATPTATATASSPLPTSGASSPSSSRDAPERASDDDTGFPVYRQHMGETREEIRKWQSDLGAAFRGPSGIVGERLKRLQQAEALAEHQGVASYGGYSIPADAFFDFAIETLDILAQPVRVYHLIRVPLLVASVSRLRASYVISWKGYFFDAASLLRGAFESAVHLCADAHGWADISSWFDTGDIDLSGAPRSVAKAMHKRRSVNDRRVESLVFRAASGLSAEDQDQLAMLVNLMHGHVHKTEMHLVHMVTKIRLTQQVASLPPSWDDHTASHYGNISLALAWMYLRLLSHAVPLQRRTSAWSLRRDVLDTSLRSWFAGWDKPLGPAIVRFMDAKFAFSGEWAEPAPMEHHPTHTGAVNRNHGESRTP